MRVSLVSGIIALASTLFINQANANDKACKKPPKACSPKAISAPVDPINYTTATALALEFDGEGLREELQKLTGGHTRYSYNCVWSFMMETDEDPDNPDNIIALYTRRSIPKVERDCGRETESGEVNRFAWNREHVWPKSLGFPRQGQYAYTDFHHLIPADKRANSNRGNKDFKAGGAPDRVCTKCQTTGVTWEPSDASKGIVARMMFYMDVRYDGIGASSGGTPDLQLVNTASKVREPRLGYLSDLLQWHCEYPVSDEERRRNDSVHKWQGNRNPFIDHPEFVEAIWDFSCDSPQVDSPKQLPAQWGDAVPTQHDTSTAAAASAAAINMNDHPTSSFDASTTLAGACMVVMLAFVVIVKRRGGYHREGYVNIATNKA